MRLLILLTLWCTGCSHSSLGRALIVKASDERGAPLAGLTVEIDGMPATKTDAAGNARISLGSQGPSRARIAIACPEGSRESNPRHVARTAQGATARLELRFVCKPLLRLLAVVVRAEGGAGAVLRADGEPIGTVAEDGTLHACVWRAPDSELQLVLDTDALAVKPRNPLREHRMGDRDELLVFDQPLLARDHPKQRGRSPKRAGRMSDDREVFGGRR
jgi:hypothetical protein